jgi:hypothetical protein
MEHIREIDKNPSDQDDMLLIHDNDLTWRDLLLMF